MGSKQNSQELYKLLQLVKKRPQMYIYGDDYRDYQNFFQGFWGSVNCHFPNCSSEFEGWFSEKNNLPETSFGFHEAILSKLSAGNEENAKRILLDQTIEFFKQRSNQPAQIE